MCYNNISITKYFFAEDVMEDIKRAIPRQTIARLPEYHGYLTALGDEKYVSARSIADALGKSEIQVRKDLAAVCPSGGRPKLGFERETLLSSIEDCLGMNNTTAAVLAGVGNLGTALLHYDGFKTCGVELAAAFDRDPAKIGTRINGVYIADISKLAQLSKRLQVHIGIITVPGEVAQAVAEQMMEAGILAIWNFAPVRLELPENIIIRNENMATSLAVLSHHLAARKLT